MDETVKTIAAIGAVFIGLPILVLLVRDLTLRLNKPSPAAYAIKRLAQLELIRNPDWAFYECHLERRIPSALQELFADDAIITRELIDYSSVYCILTFEAINEKNLIEMQQDLGHDIVAIATTDVGDPIYLRPGRSEADAVYVTHHDGGDTHVLADSVSEFVERLRFVITPR